MNRAERRARQFNHQTGGTIYVNRSQHNKGKKPRKMARVNLTGGIPLGDTGHGPDGSHIGPTTAE